MDLVVIGSGTVAPSSTRVAPCYWVSAGEVTLLLDCGAGSLHRAAELGIQWSEISCVAITHFHVDHWGELPTLLFALRWGVEPARTAPLRLIGPRGLTTRLTMLAAALGDWVLSPGYPLQVDEIEPNEVIALADNVYLEAFKTPHTAQSLAYAVTEGETRLVYTGDTGQSDALAEWAHDCDLLLAECSLPDDRAIDIHLSPTQAGSLGRAANARELVLTHFYPVYGDSDPGDAAARAFGGPVNIARDGDRFHIGIDPC